MKKVLLITRVSGFVPQFEMNNVALLQKMGYEVHYAANFDTVVYGSDNSRLEGTGICCHHIPFCRSPFSPQVMDSYHKLKNLIKEHGFDLIHCHMPMTGVVARMAAQKVRRETGRKIPLIYTAHGFHFFQGAPLKNWIYYLPERFLARYTDVLITINNEDFNRAKTFSVRGEVKQISGIGLSLENRPFRHFSKEEAFLDERPFHLISVGELNDNKNHIAALQAINKLKDTPIHYTIYGEGETKEKLEDYIQKHHLEDIVTLAGYSTDIPHILAKADGFLLPSKREGLPVALMEAMAAGLPVIAQPIRGCTDLIEHKKNGLLVSEQNFSEAIEMLVNNPKLCNDMGICNLEKIKAYSDETVKAQMNRIYSEIDREDTAK